jgi:hypothetical protein
MNPSLGAGIPGELVAIILGSLGMFFMIVVKVLDHDKETKRMKLEAELKVKLAENLQDADAIERIANLKVLRGEKPGDAQQKIVQQHQKLALEKARQQAKSGEPRIGRYVLPGLICLMLGVGFVIADTFTNGAEDLSIPGFIVGAIGLSLLSYAVFLQDMAKKAHERQRSGSSLERVR